VASPESAQAIPFVFESLGANDAAIVETFAVPRYLSWFGEVLLEILLVGESGRVAHLGCRTGYPDVELLERMPNTTLVGVEGGEAALGLARSKAAPFADRIEYVLAECLPTSLPSGQFSHVLCLHPRADRDARLELFTEMRRLLYRGGQALIALPLSSSFRELIDLLKEYALKYDDAALSKALEAAFAERLTVETLAAELEEVGLVDVDFEVRQKTVCFDSGRALVEDPVTRFFILPELQAWLGSDDLSEPARYFVEAVDKYWSEELLEVGVNIVAVSARR
jgi:SAM-dependent methyltransferase